MTKDKALKLALEALENGMKFVWSDPEREAGFVAIDAMKEALDECDEDELIIRYHEATIKRLEAQQDAHKSMVEAASQQRPWVGLTDEEVREICVNEWGINEWGGYEQCRAIEAKLKQKNLIAAGSQAFYGFPTEPVSTSNAGGKCVTAGETAPTHTLNSTKTVAVATDTYWLPIDKDTPRSAKLQLLSIGGVAQYGTLGSDVSFYTHWCPVPKKPK